MQQPKNKVLIIDDYVSNLQIFEKILSRGAYEVEFAESGVQAIELLENDYLPDVILLDLMMPVMDGYGFKREINKKPLWAKIPVIVISALDEQVNKSEAFELGCVDFMVKPISKNELLHRVNVQIQYKNQKEELRLINKQLLDANNNRDKIFSIISHDLRSSLGNLTSVFQYLLDAPIELGEDRELILDAEMNARNTYNLLENLLYWAKSQQGQNIFYPEIINLSKEVLSIAELERSSIHNKEIEFKIDIPSDINVWVDGVLLTIIIRNLIVNAIKFTDTKGHIRISSEMVDQKVLFSIADDGVGMSKSQQSKIKEDISFTTVGTHNEKGTGLGMLLVKEYVKQCKGELEMISSLGKGTTFNIILPTASEC